VRALVLAAAASAALAAPAPAFRFTDPRIAEASGIAVGLRSPGVVYVQNDSGDVNRFFAVDPRTGATAATVTVPGATNVDWEDLAVARAPAGPQVWIGDIGDNGGTRTEIRVYRVTEPRVARTDRGRALSTGRPAIWRLRYPDGPTDAEGLAVAPDGAAYVVTKSLLGRSTVYRLPPHPDPRHVQTLRRVAGITLVPHGDPNPFGIAGELAITGAAISPDGTRFAVRTYAAAYTWVLGSGGLAAALRTPPRRVPLPRQPQGEGIAFAGDRQLLVDSEGRHAAAYLVAPPPPVASSSTAPPTSTAASPTPTAAPPTAAAPSGRSWAGPALVAGAAGALAGAALLLLRRRSRRRLR